MKRLYNKIAKISAIFVMTLTISCSSDLTYQEAINKNERKIEDPQLREDARFLVDAKSLNLLEWKLSQLASSKAYAAAVMTMAKKNSNDFERMDEDLEKLAYKEKITLPDAMNDAHQSSYFTVSNADREDFDKEFLLALRKVNQENLDKFTRMATDAKDADVRAFAARKLDMMRVHEQRISEVDDGLLDTY